MLRCVCERTNKLTDGLKRPVPTNPLISVHKAATSKPNECSNSHYISHIIIHTLTIILFIFA